VITLKLHSYSRLTHAEAKYTLINSSRTVMKLALSYSEPCEFSKRSHNP
jgi:hypothetical protein